MSETVARVRNIDYSLARWVRERSGSELLERAAFAVSQAEGQGHACAALCRDDAFNPADIEALRAHAWVGDGPKQTPFVFDAHENFYTWRNWRHESRLAEALLARTRDRALPSLSMLHDDLEALFAGQDPEATRWQQVAVAAVIGARVFVLTGGPGTGKTSTALRMLAMLVCHAQAAGLPPNPNIALAAPTGKAAQRLAQAVTEGSGRLLQGLPAGHDALRSALETLQSMNAQTLHRLLGFRPRDNTYSRGPENPLLADVVVVDEASMIDLAAMRRLFDALPRHAVLILLGDPDQLYAVEAGSVLSDIVAGTEQNRLPRTLVRELAGLVQSADADAATAPLAGQVVTLTHTWRANPALQRDLQALRDGDAAWLGNVVERGGDAALHLHTCADVRALDACIDRWLDRYREIYDALLDPEAEPAQALALARRVQILCALRGGAFAAGQVNALITHKLVQRSGKEVVGLWYHGRVVIITRNDYARHLYNGDIGVALQGDAGLRVWFEGRQGPRDISPHALPEHDSAWAITIHRSQGSEYDDVAVLLPPNADSPVLSRELLYTAVSRARRGAEIWAMPDVLLRAVATPALRHGGLRERLR